MIKRFLAALKTRLLRAHCGHIGIGLVGIGGWGITTAAAVMESRRFNIRGVFDIDSHRCHHFASRWKTQAYATYEELLADPSIHAVAITVPNPLHPAIVRQAADAGKHVFIEKPLASTSHECLMLGAYCRQRNLVLLVGHQVRREPAFRTVQRLLAENHLGMPLFARGVRTLQRTNNDWRRDPHACPGGSMEQLGIHLIDVMLSLFGNPVKFSGWRRNTSSNHNEPDWGHVSLHFANQVHGVVDSSFASPNRFEFDMFCEQGQLLVRGNHLYCQRGGRATRVPTHGPSGGVAQFIEFADCIEGTATPETDAPTAAIVADIITSMEAIEGKVAA